jgi:hypothetical protein
LNGCFISTQENNHSIIMTHHWVILNLRHIKLPDVQFCPTIRQRQRNTSYTHAILAHWLLALLLLWLLLLLLLLLRVEQRAIHGTASNVGHLARHKPTQRTLRMKPTSQRDGHG